MKNDFFKDLQKELFEIKDRNPQLSEDSAFVVWFVRAFIAQDENQSVLSLTGGAGDKSSDAIYTDHDNRMVFIVQGKYHSDNNVTESRSDIIALADLGRSIVCERQEAYYSIINKANPIVKKGLKEIHDYVHNRNYRLQLSFITTGKISKTHIEEGQARVEEFDNATFETYTYDDLMILMQDYLEGAAPPIPSISLPVQGTEVFSRSDESTGIISWIFTMNGTEIGKLYEDIGIRLFARNIRGYLGNTDINQGIKNTIETEPEFFWYYNNGITIICNEAKQIKKGSSNILKVTNGQIINGQQTTITLSRAGKNNAEVLVKVIEIPRNADKSKDYYNHLISEIVSSTNWQNYISQSDLKSNDAEQVRIEKEFKKLNYYYIRKKMSKSELVNYGANRYSYKIKKEDLARAVGACTVDPYEVRMGKDRLFEDDIYSKIFNGRKAPEYLTMYWLYRSVTYWSKNDDRKVYAKWHTMHLIWVLLESDLTKISYREQFRKMIERESQFEKELLQFNKLINTTFQLAISFYSKNKKSDGKIQEARDFFKHKNLHKKFFSFYKESIKYKKRIDEDIAQLIKNIDKSIDI